MQYTFCYIRLFVSQGSYYEPRWYSCYKSQQDFTTTIVVKYLFTTTSHCPCAPEERKHHHCNGYQKPPAVFVQEGIAAIFRLWIGENQKYIVREYVKRRDIVRDLVKNSKYLHDFMSCTFINRETSRFSIVRIIAKPLNIVCILIGELNHHPRGGPTRGGTQSRNNADFFSFSRIHAMRGIFGFSRNIAKFGLKIGHFTKSRRKNLIFTN